jgi:ABC-type branched-subunit amino acid transport system permease subunit
MSEPAVPVSALPGSDAGTRSRVAVGVMCLSGLLAYPLLLSPYQMDVARDALIFALLALSLDFLWGKAGMLSFGQAAYFGIGAYAVAIIGPMVPSANAALAGLAVGIGMSILVAGSVGYFLIYGGVRGPYLTVVTLALTLIARNIATAWASVTGGEAGLIGAPSPGISIGGWSVVATDSVSLYLLVALVLAAVLLVVWLLCRGRYGRILVAIQDDEGKARSLGYDTSGHLLLVFVASGAIAALAGGLYTSVAGYVAPDLVGLLLSTQAIVHVALGGRGTLVGPVIASVVAIRLQQEVSSYSYALWPLLLGAFFIAMVFLFPNGLFPLFQRLFDMLFRRHGKGGPHG